MTTATANKCPHCNGTGAIGTWVEWSDGLGGSSAKCPLCDGKGAIDFDPARELAALKTSLRGLLYKAWLVAGCYPTMHEVSGLQPHEQGLRNEVLRGIMELGGEKAGCTLNKPDYVEAKEREVRAEQERRRAEWQREKATRCRR